MAGRADREDLRAGRAQVKPFHLASSAKDVLLAPGFHKGNLHALDLRPYFHTHRSSPALQLEAALGGVALEFGKGDLHALDMHRGGFFRLAQVKLSHLASIAKDTQIAMLVIAKDIASSVYIAKATSVALSTRPR